MASSAAVQFLSLQSVAEMFDTSPSTVRRWEEKGLIRPVMIGTLKRYDVSTLFRAAGQALDEKVGMRPNVTDPDEATRQAAEDARKDRSAKARRRNR